MSSGGGGEEGLRGAAPNRDGGAHLRRERGAVRSMSGRSAALASRAPLACSSHSHRRAVFSDIEHIRAHSPERFAT
ncbi:hypothetical protein ACWD4J_39760 [Streptomyces sp. NPDC002577]